MTSDKKSERFFKVLHDRMKRAQQETKSTVAVNMNDLGSQPREDRESADPTTKGQRSQQYRMLYWVLGQGQRLQGEGGHGARSAGRGLGVGTQGPVTSSSPSLTGLRPAGRVASFSMPGSPSRYSLGPSLRRGHEVGERVQSNEMGTSVLIMQPILRFLQLLCENHNRDLQVSACPAPPPASMWAPALPVSHALRRSWSVQASASLRERCHVHPSVLCRTSCAPRTTRPTTTWCVRHCSSWTSCAAAPPVAWGCWGFTSMRTTWALSSRPWRPSLSTVRAPATRTR